MLLSIKNPLMNSYAIQIGTSMSIHPNVNEHGAFSCIRTIWITTRLRYAKAKGSHVQGSLNLTKDGKVAYKCLMTSIRHLNAGDCQKLSEVTNIRVTVQTITLTWLEDPSYPLVMNPK